MYYADQGDYKKAYETLLNFMSLPEENSWLKDYNNLFPTEKEVFEARGIPIDYSPRQSLTQVTSRMKSFMKRFMAKEFPEIGPKDRPAAIMEATRLYIADRAADNYKFIKKSTKFIYDNDGSVLLTYLRKYLSGEQVVEVGKAVSW